MLYGIDFVPVDFYLKSKGPGLPTASILSDWGQNLSKVFCYDLSYSISVAITCQRSEKSGDILVCTDDRLSDCFLLLGKPSTFLSLQSIQKLLFVDLKAILKQIQEFLSQLLMLPLKSPNSLT